MRYLARRILLSYRRSRVLRLLNSPTLARYECLPINAKQSRTYDVHTLNCSHDFIG